MAGFKGFFDNHGATVAVWVGNGDYFTQSREMFALHSKSPDRWTGCRFEGTEGWAKAYKPDWVLAPVISNIPSA